MTIFYAKLEYTIFNILCNESQLSGTSVTVFWQKLELNALFLFCLQACDFLGAEQRLAWL